MTLSELSVTIPGWLTLVLAASCVLLSIQMIRWYLEAADPYPPLAIELPFLAERDDRQSEDD